MSIKSLKKVLSAVLVLSFLMGTGCDLFGSGDNKAVAAAAEALAADMVLADADKLISDSDLEDDSDEAVKLTELLDNDSASSDELDFYEAVEATIEYKVDTESCSVKSNKASIDIVFTMVDYNAVLKGDYSNIGGLIKAIKKADTKDVKFTAEFVKDGKNWVASNVGSKKFLSFYGYRDAEIKIAMSVETIAGFIDTDKSDFALTTYGQYFDTPMIQYDFYFDSAVHDYADRGIILNVELYQGTKKLDTLSGFVFGSSTILTYKVLVTDIYQNGRQTFEEGKYTIKLLTDDDQLVYEESVNVQANAIMPTPAPNGNNDLMEGEGVYFAFIDEDFRSQVIEAGWWDYEYKMSDENTYDHDVNTIAFSLEVPSTCTRSVVYFYAYRDPDKDEDIDEALSHPEYTATISPQEYDNGFFYDIDYPVNGQAKSGIYMMVLADATTGQYLMYAYCVVS